ncbi:hypothetical protein ENSA5_19120 [Enhygromyxa salina]|uniref:Uncharacterized protein n=1 Tax=Enhygromyxa salina TaxID=215803 RepID=A0A2S9YD03_9BACT|nr:hypothetical protein ENSA5_19120 [Enhygromyxa salina]
MLAAIASAACVTDPASDGDFGATGESGCFDGTEGPGIGDDGCLFLPGCAEDEDDGATEKLDMDRSYADLGCDPECPPPPEHEPLEPPHPVWLHHETSDTYYRHASEMELEVHSWPVGTTIMSAAANVDALVNGTDRTVSLGLPLATTTGRLEFETLDITRRRTKMDVWNVSSRDAPAGPVVDAFRPEVHMFLPNWVNLDSLHRGVPPGTQVFAVAFADSHGGVAIQGLNADQDFFISGPTTKIWLEVLPPDGSGVLISKPELHTTGFDDVLSHWIELAAEQCDNTTCAWESDLDEEDPANCGDCVDNDADADVDAADLACRDRSDYGCDGYGPHNHRWENSKDFAEMPDIEWCTQMAEDGLPWHTELYAKASLAAAMLNAIPAAVSLHPDYEIPADVATVRYRFAYCVFADSVEDAHECVSDGSICPSDYALAGVTHIIDTDSPESRAYFRALWDEFDVAMAKLEDQGVTAKPVAMLSGVYSGNIDDPVSLTDGIVGLAPVGELSAHLMAGGLGASMVESSYFVYIPIAHELGHLLGLSHTDVDPHFNQFGFMKMTVPAPPYAILGPSLDPGQGYQYTSQWSLWVAKIGDKSTPRPNAFAHTGCSVNADCPSQLECWNAGADGICRYP